MKSVEAIKQQTLKLKQFKYTRLIEVAIIEGNKRTLRLVKKKYKELQEPKEINKNERRNKS